MAERREAVIISAARTPTGKFLGSLKGFTAPQLGALVVRESVRRAGVASACRENFGITSVASSSMERCQSLGWSQSWPPMRSVPKWPVSSRSATSWSSTRRGLPAIISARLIVSMVTSSSGTSAMLQLYKEDGPAIFAKRKVTSNLRLKPAHAFYERLGFRKTSWRFGKQLDA